MADAEFTFMLQGNETVAWLDTGSGQFRTYVGGDTVYGGTLDELRKKATVKLRQDATKVAVPFSEVDLARFTVRHGTATGIHGANQNVLVRWSDGKAEQLSSYGHGRVRLQRLDDAEIGKYLALRNSLSEAARAVREFEDVHKIGLEKAVREAVAKAMAEGGGTT